MRPGSSFFVQAKLTAARKPFEQGTDRLCAGRFLLFFFYRPLNCGYIGGINKQQFVVIHFHNQKFIFHV
ncbi:MAG: hypothetical protein GX750_10155 [Clostridia bacterium]|nr:hypothetical protein [Clostridia bacterium]